MHAVRLSGALWLNTLKIGDKRVDLIRLELELRHVGMPNEDAFCEGLLQFIDRIVPRQRPKRRRLRMRALTLKPDGVAARTKGLGELMTLLDLRCAILRVRNRRHCQSQGKEGSPKHASKADDVPGFRIDRAQTRQWFSLCTQPRPPRVSANTACAAL